MVICITGGAGTGKSFVSDIIRNDLNFPVIDSDSITKKLMEKGNLVYQKVIECFGEEYLSEDGEIDRVKLADFVFNDEIALKQLNNITHPATIGKINNMISESESELIFVESAIPFIAEYNKFCDKFIYVYTSLEDRILRLKRSRNYSDEKINSILNSQMSDKEFRLRCDYILNNPDKCSREYILTQLIDIINDFN